MPMMVIAHSHLCLEPNHSQGKAGHTWCNQPQIRSYIWNNLLKKHINEDPRNRYSYPPKLWRDENLSRHLKVGFSRHHWIGKGLQKHTDQRLFLHLQTKRWEVTRAFLDSSVLFFPGCVDYCTRSFIAPRTEALCYIITTVLANVFSQDFEILKFFLFKEAFHRYVGPLTIFLGSLFYLF